LHFKFNLSKLSVMKKASYILSFVLAAVMLLSNFAQAQERRPWSPQAKGTVIGAGTGAAAGAIIHKRNRVLGGVVGGVVGGATGYAVGKHKDNKNKEAARVAAANRAAAERAAERAVANRTTAAKKKPAEPANPGQAANQYPAVAYTTGYMAGQPAMSYDAYGNPVPRIMHAAYLPNASYGDPNKPYSTFEYRRKSW
jgi:hypothetical protein